MGIFAKNVLSSLKKVWSSTKHVKQVNGPLIDASITTQE